MKNEVRTKVGGLSIFHRLLWAFIGISLFIVVILGSLYFLYSRKTIKIFANEQVAIALVGVVEKFDKEYDTVISGDLTLLESMPSFSFRKRAYMERSNCLEGVK